MRKEQVSNPAQALAYITDCNLATVADMAGRKSRGKAEYKRQISIAQVAIDRMVDMKIDISTTRAQEIVDQGLTVEQWSRKYEPAR